MVQAVVRDSIQNVRTLKFAHTAAVEINEVIVANGQVLVAVNKAEADAENGYIYRGKIEVPKTAALAIAPGEVCYWDSTNEEANKTASGNTKAGICVESAAAADSVVLIMLRENT